MNEVEWPRGVAMVLVSPSGDVREMSEAAETMLGESMVDFVSLLRTQPPTDNTIMDLDHLKLQLNVLKTKDANYLMLVDLNAECGDGQQKIQSLKTDLKREHNRLATKVNLTATIAHEFGNPISAIRTRTHILRNHLSEFSEARIVQSLDHIDAQLNHMVELLHDLTLVNQISTARSGTEAVPFHLGVFCQKLLAEMTLRAEVSSVLMTTRGDVSHVRLNQRLIRYIVLNLVGNALKYSPNGAEVRLDIQALDDQITLMVSDHGIGIPEEELPRIFTEYYRASNAAYFNGSGLGLAIMKTCIEMYGGTIAAESKLNEGTTFTVSLPLKND